MTFPLPHFVSASAGGNCFCGRPATHKLGEEIPHDEPCMSCGETWRYPNAGGTRESTSPGACKELYHHVMGPNRHNLTAYVCCFHWMMVLGPAAGCPLSDKDKHALEVYRYAWDPDPGYSPPVEILCPRCDGKMKVEGANPINIVAGCLECGCGCYMANKDKVDAAKET
jgi:hypothetical protein